MPRYNQAGQYRHRLAIQTATEVADAHGKAKQTWATAETVWGSVIDLTGREFEIAQQIDSRVSTRCDMRHNTTVTSGTRIVHDSRNLFVIYVINVDGRNIKTQAFCEEQT